MEGKFSSEGLQAINDEDDILMAMARELVTEKRIGERADSVWATLQKKQEEVLGVQTHEADDLEAANGAAALAAPEIQLVNQWSALAGSLEPTRRKNSRLGATPQEQLTLF
jgi:hypothetical protein